MVKLVWNENFERRYKKWARKHPDLISTFEEKVSLFEVEPFHPSLKTHMLRGKLNKVWAIYINYEYRLTVRFEEEHTVAILVNVGSHEEVY